MKCSSVCHNIQLNIHWINYYWVHSVSYFVSLIIKVIYIIIVMKFEFDFNSCLLNGAYFASIIYHGIET